MLVFDRQESLTKPGKRAIDSEIPYRDEMSVTPRRYMLRNGISEQQKSGPCLENLGRSPAKLLAGPCSQPANERYLLYG